MPEKSAAIRARRAADIRRCRIRQALGAACYYVECDAETFDLLVRFEGLALHGFTVEPVRAGPASAQAGILTSLERESVVTA